jgi:SET domain
MLAEVVHKKVSFKAYNTLIAEVLAFNTIRVKIGLSNLGYGYANFAKMDFLPGEEVMKGFGKKINHQTGHISIQISKDQHFLPTKWTGRYWNHSCEPNCSIQTRPDGFPSLIATEKIRKGDEITYSYSMTEFEWSNTAKENHVKCLCGQKNCKRKILSFSQLTRAEQDSLINNTLCSKYLWKYNKFS